MLTLNNAAPVGRLRQVLPGGRSGDGLGAVTGDYRTGEAIAQRVHQPGFAAPQGFDAAAKPG